MSSEKLGVNAGEGEIGCGAVRREAGVLTSRSANRELGVPGRRADGREVC
jgi:hypothetical protein